jgi:hypothetical protein
MAHQHHDVGGHVSADDEYLVTPPGAGYEHTDTDVWIIVKFGLWLVIAALVIHVLMGLMFALFVTQTAETNLTFPLAVGQEERLPAAPRLQAIPVNEVYQFRQQEEQTLRNYGWIDRSGGRVQIPIDEAMRLAIERLPARTAAPEAASSPQDPGLMPADSSAGRTTERRRQ